MNEINLSTFALDNNMLLHIDVIFVTFDVTPCDKDVPHKNLYSQLLNYHVLVTMSLKTEAIIN